MWPTHPSPAPTTMKVLTVLMVLSLALIALTVGLTATSNERITWDESLPILVALSLLFLVTAIGRSRAARRAGGGTEAHRPLS